MLDQLSTFVNAHPWQALVNAVAVLGWLYGAVCDHRLRKLERRIGPILRK